MYQVQTRGAITWQVLIFLPMVAGFPQPRSHTTWILIFWYFFYNESKSIIVGGTAEEQHIEKTLLQEYVFLRFFYIRDF
jgi:hypothetical protein